MSSLAASKENTPTPARSNKSQTPQKRSSTCNKLVEVPLNEAKTPKSKKRRALGDISNQDRNDTPAKDVAATPKDVVKSHKKRKQARLSTKSSEKISSTRPSEDEEVEYAAGGIPSEDPVVPDEEVPSILEQVTDSIVDGLDSEDDVLPWDEDAPLPTFTSKNASDSDEDEIVPFPDDNLDDIDGKSDLLDDILNADFGSDE